MNGNDIAKKPGDAPKTLSTKPSLRPLGGGAKRQSDKVAPKSKVPAHKAARKVDAAAKLQRATTRRAKCMEGSRRLTGYFNKPKVPGGRASSPETVVISSDDGSSSAAEVYFKAREAERRASRFVDIEAGCSSDDPGEDASNPEETQDPTMGGFIVSDDHLSADEDSGWADVYCARRVATPESPVLSDKEEQKEPESPEPEQSQPSSPDMGWEVGAQPLSPILSPQRS